MIIIYVLCDYKFSHGCNHKKHILMFVVTTCVWFVHYHMVPLDPITLHKSKNSHYNVFRLEHKFPLLVATQCFVVVAIMKLSIYIKVWNLLKPKNCEHFFHKKWN